MGGVEVMDKLRVENIVYGEEIEDLDFWEWLVVNLLGGRFLVVCFLVGVDGVNSFVWVFVGIGSNGWDYGWYGVVVILKMEGDGWGGDYCKIVY